ncbi:uncharacterized protein LOC132608210 [Lycium barbarum]|uniref:uncharacterized protein LOC132608210 n=1 Tax=Lycium barbarum TaxID=112863 RepID=UPI00293EE29F|nr:uncharacterized protein LOC132608210 [Lycium barbarum]
MTIKLVVGGFILHIISVHAQQAGLGEEEKSRFGEDLDEMMGGIPPTEKIFIKGDFNRHIGLISGGYDLWFRGQEWRRSCTVDLAQAFRLVIVNSSFPKKEEHLVTFHNSVAKMQIEFLLLRKDDKGLCKD